MNERMHGLTVLFNHAYGR